MCFEIMVLVSRDNVEIFGVNSRMDTINSQILKYRLKKLDDVIKRRRKNVEIYRKNLQIDQVNIIKCKEIEYNSFVMFIVLQKIEIDLQVYLKRIKYRVFNLLFKAFT